MNIVFQDIKNNINNKNQNFICAIVGRVGVGKSYVGLRLCELISPRFKVENVVFSAKDFLNLINSDKLQKGDAMLWDEMSINLFSRDFMALQNKLILHVLTTFRTRNIFLAFTCPSLDFVDIGVRRLCHAIVEPFSVNRREEINYIKFKRTRVDAIHGDVRYPFPRIIDKDGAISTVKKIILHKSKLTDEYEIKRKNFADQLALRVERDILKSEDIERRRNITDNEIIEIGNKEGIDWKITRKVCARFGIAKDRVYRIQAKVEGELA